MNSWSDPCGNILIKNTIYISIPVLKCVVDVCRRRSWSYAQVKLTLRLIQQANTTTKIEVEPPLRHDDTDSDPRFRRTTSGGSGTYTSRCVKTFLQVPLNSFSGGDSNSREILVYQQGQPVSEINVQCCIPLDCVHSSFFCKLCTFSFVVHPSFLLGKLSES